MIRVVIICSVSGDMQMRSFIFLIFAAGMFVLSGQAAAQDRYYSRTVLSGVRQAAPPAPSQLQVSCGPIQEGVASSGPTIARFGVMSKANAPAACANYANANNIASGVCIVVNATGEVSLNQGSLIGWNGDYGASACSIR